MKNIILIGFMGSGKSYLGSKLAESMNCDFHDLDKLIISSQNCTIIDIFKKKGEKYFRKLESDYLLNFNFTGILATGGGIIEEKINRDFLQRYSALIIWFNPTFQTIFDRIKNSSRPHVLFKNQKQLFHLWEKRCQLYQECANLILSEEECNDLQFIEKKLGNT